jgi:hypothetical protein
MMRVKCVIGLCDMFVAKSDRNHEEWTRFCGLPNLLSTKHELSHVVLIVSVKTTALTLFVYILMPVP